MAKINGFVELSQEYVWEHGSEILARIEEKRAAKKVELISEGRQKLEQRTWLQKLLNTPKKEYSDEFVWDYFENHNNREFMTFPPSAWVNGMYEELEKQVLEVMKACQNVDKILINSEMSHWMTISKTF
jgi:hypothetical protein